MNLPLAGWQPVGGPYRRAFLPGHFSCPTLFGRDVCVLHRTNTIPDLFVDCQPESGEWASGYGLGRFKVGLGRVLVGAVYWFVKRTPVVVFVKPVGLGYCRVLPGLEIVGLNSIAGCGGFIAGLVLTVLAGAGLAVPAAPPYETPEGEDTAPPTVWGVGAV